jgi:spermidine synthase
MMGTEGMKRFGQGGILNTDDNLYLEFSAPFSIATPSVMEANVNTLSRFRESILPYLVPAPGPQAHQAQQSMWDRRLTAGRIADPALALFLGGKTESSEFGRLLGELEASYPEYAPGRFLKREYQSLLAMEPRPLRTLPLVFLNEAGTQVTVEFSAVLVPVSKTRASIMFVDNRARVVYGQLYVDDYDRGDFVGRFVDDVMATVRSVYRQEWEIAAGQQRTFPAARSVERKIRNVIKERILATSNKP